MRFGIVCPAMPGHIQPMGAIGRELIARGHEAIVYNIVDSEASVRKAGLDFRPIGQDRFPLGQLDDYLKAIQRVDAKTVISTVNNWAKPMASAFCLEVSQAAMRGEIDALLMDQCQFEGLTISELSGIPYLSISNALVLDRDASGDTPPPFTSWDWADGRRLKRLRNRMGYSMLGLMFHPIIKTINQFRRERQLRPMKHWTDAISRRGVVCNMTQSFDFPRDGRDYEMLYVGPYLDDQREPVPFPYEKLNGKPLVYASMGTLHTNQSHFHQIIAQACAELPVQLAISRGRWRSSVGSETIPLPGDPIVVDFVPQLEILKRAQIVITHSGLNTTMEALAQGCRLLAIPLASDQPGVAKRIQRSGAGIAIPPAKVNVASLRDALRALLENEDYRRGALSIQEDIRRAGGLSAAADIIEQRLGSNVGEPMRDARQVLSPARP